MQRLTKDEYYLADSFSIFGGGVLSARSPKAKRGGGRYMYGVEWPGAEEREASVSIECVGNIKMMAIKKLLFISCLGCLFRRLNSVEWRCKRRW